MTSEVLFIIGLALVLDFLNGFHDSSNIVATVISSRAMAPRRALLMTAIAHFVGPFLFGVAVATTIGHEVVVEEAATIAVVLAALAALGATGARLGGAPIVRAAARVLLWGALAMAATSAIGYLVGAAGL